MAANSEDASIRMTVDSSQAMSEQQRYVQAARETFNILLEKSDKYNFSLKERQRWLENEINLLKERNRLATQETVSRLQSDPTLSTKDRSRLIRETKEEGQSDVEELKQLNRQFKQWTGDQKTFQQKTEKFNDVLSRTLPGVLGSDTAAGMLTSASTGILAGGMIGTLAAVAVAKEVKGAMQMEPAVRDYAILRGRSMLGLKEEVSNTSDLSLGKYGLTPSQYFTNYAQLLRAGSGTLNERALDVMNAEKALGLSRQTTTSLLGVERYGTGKITNIESYFEKYLRSTSQSIAVLPEILQTFTTEATRMVRTSGVVDSAAIAASISTISRGFGLKGEPLQNVYSAMTQGLQQSSNSTVQAMQFAAMERAKPGASLWEMQMAMENPMENPQYVVNMLKMLQQTSAGGREGYARNIQNVLGISANLADKLSRGEITPEMFTEELNKFSKTGVGGFGKRAADVTGATEEATATWQGFWERTGFNNAQVAAEIIKGLLDGIKTTIASVEEDRSYLRKQADDLLTEARRSANAAERLNKIMQASDLYWSTSPKPFD